MIRSKSSRCLSLGLCSLLMVLAPVLTAWGAAFEPQGPGAPSGTAGGGSRAQRAPTASR